MCHFPIVKVDTFHLETANIEQAAVYLDEIATLKKIVIRHGANKPLTAAQVRLFKKLPVHKVILGIRFFESPSGDQIETINAIAELSSSPITIVKADFNDLGSDFDRDFVHWLEPLANVRMSTSFFEITSKPDVRNLAIVLGNMKNLTKFTIYTDRTMYYAADMIKKHLSQHVLRYKEYHDDNEM